MNGRTESPSNENPARQTIDSLQKTDTPLPLTPGVSDRDESPMVRADPGERMISGIDLLDFGAGGLVPRKVYLIKGAAGVGKSLLGLQYLTRGLEQQEPGILITDQRPSSVLEQARAIGFTIESAVSRGQLVILNPSNRYFDLVESPADVMAIVDELRDLIADTGAKRLVIDPVFTLINTSYSSHFALSITQSLINALEDLPVTTLLIAGEGGDVEHDPIISQLEHNAFGVICLSGDSATGGRVMRSSKLRYASNDDLVAHYRILNGRGLINYRSENEERVDPTKPWEVTSETKQSVLLLGATAETARRVGEALGSNYEFAVESDLTEGVARAKRERPGLVIVMPSRSRGAVSAILDLAQHTTSSVAFLSPHSQRQGDKVLYLRAGADDFITEPFTPAELRARVDALIRRSGRRLNLRGTRVGSISADDMAALLNSSDDTTSRRRGPVIACNSKGVCFATEFSDRIQRNVDTVAKFDQPFALYWVKGDDSDNALGGELARLCRQEDIVCHNRNGEFVCILTGTDQNGVKGFEARLHEKLGKRIVSDAVKRGFSLYQPGEPTENFTARLLHPE